MTSTTSRRDAIISRSVLQGDPARHALRSGIRTMVNLVRPTLGPAASRTAISGTLPTSAPETLDSAGVIARRVVEIDGQYENMGAMLLRQLIWTMHDDVGDGGATAAVVASHLMETASRYVDAGGDTVAVIRGIGAAAEMAIASLSSQSRRVRLPADLARIVESAMGDATTSQMIAEALDATGPDGALFLRTSPSGLTECEYAAGAIWDSKALASSLAPGAHTAIQHPCVIACDFEVFPADVIAILEACLAAGERSLLLIAPALNGEAAGLLAANRDKGPVPHVLAMKAPPSHGAGQQSLEDIALVTGARLFSKVQGDSLRHVTMADVGRARQAWATNATIGIVGGKGPVPAIQRRMRQLQRDLESAPDDNARETLRKRIGRLASLTVTLRAGGRTEREQEAFRARMEAGIAAGRAAMTSGVVPGGGMALLAASRAIDVTALAGDEAVGARLLARSLEQPFRTIAANAGLRAPLETVEAERGQVFDVLGRTWGDPWDSGIVDPLLVPQRVIELTRSFVTTILRTNTLVHKRQPDISLDPRG